MPHQLSPRGRRSALAQHSEEVWVACLTISGPGLETFRIHTDNVPLERASGVFLPYPFETPLPEDVERPTGELEIRICNVDRAVTQLLKEYQGVPKATLEIVLASQPDTVERGPFDFTVKGASVDEMVISLKVGHQESLLNSQVPAGKYTPSNSPGLFLR